MTGVKPRVFQPKPEAHAVYKEIYPLYRKMHDALGTKDWNGNLHDVMKRLIEIRNRVRR
jgi:L-ribulokinase